MAFPESMIAEYLEKAEGCGFRGVPIKDLSRNELIVAVMMGWETIARISGESKKRMNFVSSIRVRG